MYIISTSQGFLQVHDCKVWAFPHTTPHLFWNFSMPITNQPVDINPFSIFHSCTSHLQLISLSLNSFFSCLSFCGKPFFFSLSGIGCLLYFLAACWVLVRGFFFIGHLAWSCAWKHGEVGVVVCLNSVLELLLLLLLLLFCRWVLGDMEVEYQEVSSVFSFFFCVVWSSYNEIILLIGVWVFCVCNFVCVFEWC